MGLGVRLSEWDEVMSCYKEAVFIPLKRPCGGAWEDKSAFGAAGGKAAEAGCLS